MNDLDGEYERQKRATIGVSAPDDCGNRGGVRSALGHRDGHAPCMVTFSRARHTDWWKCETCCVVEPVITAMYEYHKDCSSCRRCMVLMVRTADDSPPPFPGRKR